MAVETELETVKRHLRNYKQFEFEERMLRQKYEKALIEIANTDKKNQKDWKQVAVQLIEIAEKVVKDKLD